MINIVDENDRYSTKNRLNLTKLKKVELNGISR